jgi:hypothetical protein
VVGVFEGDKHRRRIVIAGKTGVGKRVLCGIGDFDGPEDQIGSQILSNAPD